MPQLMIRAALCALCALCAFATLACDKQAAPRPGATPAASSTATPSTTPTTAQDSPAPASQEAARALAKAPLLYKIDGVHGPVYLLGTIHVGVNPETHFGPDIWGFFERSKAFVMETDLSKAQTAMLQRTTLPQGQTLQAQLGPEAWSKLDALLDQRAQQYNSVRAWVIVSLLLLKMIPEDVDRSASMDQQFLTKATKAGKTLGFLEPPELQLKILDETMTPEELKEMVMDFEKQRGELKEMLEVYQRGDVEQLERISFKELDKKPDRYELLFFKRNEAWIPHIEGYIQGQGAFIAFGAGHLFGERGVLKLLEAKGHTIQRYPFE